MSLRSLIESMPLGTTLLVSNGKPQPSARFSRKLSEWEFENYSGTLVSIETASGQRPAFMLREGEWDDHAPVVLQRRYNFDSSLRFEVQRRPKPGSARVVRNGRRELLHLAADHAEAAKWLASNLISNALIEIVPDQNADAAEEAT